MRPRRSSIVFLFLLLTALLSAPAPSKTGLALPGPSLLASTDRAPAGVALQLTTSNDFVAGNARTDDLYTADLGIDLRRGAWTLRLGERMFTDRERDLRFDETSALVTRDLRLGAAGDLWLQLGLGAVHVGEGVLGEDVQNALHRVIGADEVHLSYLDPNRWHARLTAGVARPLTWARALGSDALVASAHLDVAPDLRSTAKVDLRSHWQLTGDVALQAAVGARADRVDFAPLARRVEDAGPTAQLSVMWQRLSLTWSHNRYGTASNHLRLGYRFAIGTPAADDGAPGALR
ncbi:MAG: hypothetical protein AAF772_07800 [Acidobacteriota bacterium]